MNWGAIRIVYGKELRDSLRDRRTIISMIVVPVLAIPLLIFGLGTVMFKTVAKAREEIPRVMVVGGENSPKVLAALRAAKGFQIVAATDDYTNAILEKRVRAVVKVPADFDALVAHGERANVEVFEYQGEINSRFATENVNGFLQNLRETTVRERLEGRGVPTAILTPFVVQRENVAPPAKIAGNILGGMLPYIVIILCMTGAMYPATDLTAGEKERGTLETVLCSPVGRTELVLGKFLMVLTASLGTVLLSLVSMGATFQLAKHFLAGPASQEALRNFGTIGAGALAGVFLMLLPLAVMLSAVLLMVGLFSKSFREAQSYCGPLMIIVMAPAIAAMLPGVELSASLALVPLLNVCLVCKEMMSDTWHWGYIWLIFDSTCLYAALALVATTRMFQREDVLFRS
jgi:sodium transport system permease protein